MIKTENEAVWRNSLIIPERKAVDYWIERRKQRIFPCFFSHVFLFNFVCMYYN